VKLLLKRQQAKQLETISKEYIDTVNTLVSRMASEGKVLKLSSKDVLANLPSAVRNQAIRDAKSVYRRSKVIKRVPVLKKPVCIWNNQNYSLEGDIIEVPVMQNGKCERIPLKVIMTGYHTNILQSEGIKYGALRIAKKSGKWVAQISVTVPYKEKKEQTNSTTAGIDLGLKVPAVVVTEAGNTRFFGNGRQNKYIRRKYKAKRIKLGKLKKLSGIRNLHDKEQRWMKDQDHKISREIVNHAIKNNVSVIRMEELQGIRNTAKTSRKNEKNLHTWSFYRLAQFIEYKAKMAGISVEYVDPRYTSRICPVCGTLNKARDRIYLCRCGYRTHRDILGAMNILKAPVADGVA